MAAPRQRLHPRYLHKSGIHAPTLNSLAITALSCVMWVWLAFTQCGHGFAIVEPRNFFEKYLPAANPRKFCPTKISRHTVFQYYWLFRFYCLGFNNLLDSVCDGNKNFSYSVSVCTNVTSSLVFYIVYFVQNLLPSATVSCCSRIGERLPVVTPMEPEVIRLHIILFSCIKINTRSLNK